MKCIAPITLKSGITVNCGRCHACRINYTSSWTLRLLYELGNPEWNYNGVFLTLTYDDEHLPQDNGLHKKELQQFWKNLRQNLYDEFGYTYKIKYYACGEYGDKEKKYFSPGASKPHGRPHYHAIVFGLDYYNSVHRDIVKKSWQKCDSLRFDYSNKHSSGFERVCREDIAYVTGYVQKKLNGDMAIEQYGTAQIPFSACSHFMGIYGMEQDAVQLKQNGFTYLNGHKIGIPRYFREKLEIVQADITNTSTLSLDKLEESNKKIYKQFEIAMRKQNTWYPENLKMMAIRFERYINDCQFALSKQIERDYIQKKILQGRYL